MNTFLTLLVAVAAVAAVPAESRSALSKALDLVDELQTLDVPGFGTTTFSESKATKMIEDIQFILSTARAGLQEKAEKEQTAIDPETLRNLDLMEQFIPKTIRIVADMTSGAKEDPSLEPALPDMTGQVAAAPPAVVRSATGLPVPLPALNKNVVFYNLPGGGYYYRY